MQFNHLIPEIDVSDLNKSLNFYFQIIVNSLDLILERISKENVTLMKDPWESRCRIDEAFVRQREFLIQDPDGYLLRFAEHLS